MECILWSGPCVTDCVISRQWPQHWIDWQTWPAFYRDISCAIMMHDWPHHGLIVHEMDTCSYLVQPIIFFTPPNIWTQERNSVPELCMTWHGPGDIGVNNEERERDDTHFLPCSHHLTMTLSLKWRKYDGEKWCENVFECLKEEIWMVKDMRKRNPDLERKKHHASVNLLMLSHNARWSWLSGLGAGV